MDATSSSAWQPITPQGVAAFAHANLRRLLLVQFVVALLVASGVAWLLHTGFFPTVNAAIAQLPPEGEIRSARLDWQGESPKLLAESRHLSLAVDLEHSGSARSLAHFQIEFGRTNTLVHSLLGYTAVNYPAGWTIAFNRLVLEPRWGAWRPVLLAAVMAVVVTYLMVSWFLLALIYCGPIWLLGFFTNRNLDVRASWRLAGAALLPGALAMLMAIAGYALGMLDLVSLGFAFAAHLVVGWVYLGLSLFFVPPLGQISGGKNPFVPGSE